MKLQQLISGKKAFLFDFDGVVTDSEPYAFMTLKAVMKDSFGIDIDDSDIWVLTPPLHEESIPDMKAAASAVKRNFFIIMRFISLYIHMKIPGPRLFMGMSR